MNYYEILNVKRTATYEEIKQSYRILIKKYHPDTYSGNKSYAEEKTKEINIAYETLKNEEKRKNYDEMLNFVEQFSNSQNTTSKNSSNHRKNSNTQQKSTNYSQKNYTRVSPDSQYKTNNNLIKVSILSIVQQKNLFSNMNVDLYELEINLLIINVLIFYLTSNSKNEQENLLNDFKNYSKIFNNYISIYNKLISNINDIYTKALISSATKNEISPILATMIQILFIDYTKYLSSQAIINICLYCIELLFYVKNDFEASKKCNTSTQNSNSTYNKTQNTTNDSNHTQYSSNTSQRSTNNSTHDIQNTFNNFFKIIQSQKTYINNYYNISIHSISTKLLILNSILTFEKYIKQYKSISLLNYKIYDFFDNEYLDKEIYQKYIYYLNKYLIYDSKNYKNESMPANIYIALDILYSTEKLDIQTAQDICNELIHIFDNFFQKK